MSQAPGRRAMADRKIRQKKILVVDDDSSIREILSTQLGRLRYDTLTAADGEEAVQLFRRAKPDLVVNAAQGAVGEPGRRPPAVGLLVIAQEVHVHDRHTARDVHFGS